MIYVSKDITTVFSGVIAHGVNCQGAMGSGVARAIRDKWPLVYEVYKRSPTGKMMLGVCHLVTIETGQLFVCNCYTQVFYGKGCRFASPEGIEQALGAVYEWASYFDLPVYMPKIGAGLGGLDWEIDVEPIVARLDAKYPQIETYICVIGEESV